MDDNIKKLISDVRGVSLDEESKKEVEEILVRCETRGKISKEDGERLAEILEEEADLDRIEADALAEMSETVRNYLDEMGGAGGEVNEELPEEEETI